MLTTPTSRQQAQDGTVNQGGHQRISAREPVMQPGKLIFVDGEQGAVTDCFVRDISEHGAGIECDQAEIVPKNVILQFGEGHHHEAEVAWRLEKRIGLRFRPQRRKSVRRRQLKAAQLVINQSGSVIDCRLRDISDHGAGLEVDNAQHVPDEVTLKVGDDVEYEGEVVWRSENRLGLQFKLRQQTTDVMETLARHRSALETGASGMVEVANAFESGHFSHLNHPDIAPALENVATAAKSLLDALADLTSACSGETEAPSTEAGATDASSVEPTPDGDSSLPT